MAAAVASGKMNSAAHTPKVGTSATPQSSYHAPPVSAPASSSVQQQSSAAHQVLSLDMLQKVGWGDGEVLIFAITMRHADMYNADADIYNDMFVCYNTAEPAGGSTREQQV